MSTLPPPPSDPYMDALAAIVLEIDGDEERTTGVILALELANAGISNPEGEA